MENQLAKALYDNTAECPDELAFRKGDVVTVMDTSVADTSGWWLCSLHGRQGVAPANRLQLLPPPPDRRKPLVHRVQQESVVVTGEDDVSEQQNIYQIPSVPRSSGSPLYERMDKFYKVPSGPSSTLPKSPSSSALSHARDWTEAKRLSALGLFPTKNGALYDIPSTIRPNSHSITSTAQMSMRCKASLGLSSLTLTQESERKPEAWESERCSSPDDTYVYAVPPTQCREPCYDIPVPSATESKQRSVSNYNTLPNPRKGNWIYDVPATPERPGQIPASYGTIPSKAPVTKPLPPPSASLSPSDGPSPSLYAVPSACSPPKPSPGGCSLPASLSRVIGSLYSKPPAQRSPEDLVYAVPPQEHLYHIPLECRGDTANPYGHTRARLHRMRTVLGPASLRDRPTSSEELLGAEEDGDGRRSDSRQRISTASSSSTSSSSSSSSSSCDSMAQSPASSSSSPEPLREVTLSQEEASGRLLELREAVGGAVPRLMEFVSSSWRCREHLEQHLGEIREAAEGIDRAVTGFLNFALDIRGNARRLSDGNLRARLLKQLSIVEDSGVILRQTVCYLSAAGWPLDVLAQDPGQAHTPDQLERFVMVARTVPEDVKRLVSILNANARLLFRPGQKEGPRSAGSTDGKRATVGSEQRGDAADDDNDYVQLQTKNDFEKQKLIQAETKEGMPSPKTLPGQMSPIGPVTPTQKAVRAGSGDEPQKRPPHTPEHCRLYFGALQKAIVGFVGSLRCSQPPEQFIPHSKLVIMVGQRLVNTLYKEARSASASLMCKSNLLCKSSHLCALLKQLAVATKKAALHFPDKQALQEVEDFAKELAQRAQHFRTSLEI